MTREYEYCMEPRGERSGGFLKNGANHGRYLETALGALILLATFYPIIPATTRAFPGMQGIKHEIETSIFIREILPKLGQAVLCFFGHASSLANPIMLSRDMHGVVHRDINKA